MPITRVNEFHAAEGRADELVTFLKGIIATIRAAEGCLSVELLRDPDEASHVAIVEQWTSVAAHQAAAALIPKGRVLQVLPMLDEPPAGRYYEPVP